MSRQVCKKSWGFIVLLPLVLGLVLTSPEAVLAKEVKLRLAHSEAVTNIRHDVVLQFVKRAGELSKGELKIEVFPAGVMGTHTSCQEQVSMGTLDFYITTAGLVSVFDPTRTQELIELPYLFDTYSQAYAFMDTDYVAKFYEPLTAKGIRYLATWDNGFRHMTNNVRPIFKPEDMKGIKVRVVQSEMSMKIISSLGGNPVPMSYSELYTAMGSGVVDGQENPFMNIFASKFFEVQKFMSVTKHQYSTLPLIFAEKTWQKLTPAQQKALKQAALEAAPYMRKKVGANEDAQRAAMEKAGMKINDVPDMKPFREAVQAVYAWARGKWGGDKVNEVLGEVEKIRQKYPAGKVYFGPGD